MIRAEQIREILALYAKHGWLLRRVLLSDGLRVEINELLQELFAGAEIVSSPLLNAAWFSRASGKTNEAWELRHLSEAPFALVEVFPSEIETGEREKILNEMQTRLANQTSKSARRSSE